MGTNFLNSFALSHKSHKKEPLARFKPVTLQPLARFEPITLHPHITPLEKPCWELIGIENTICGLNFMKFKDKNV